ncbi:MAG: ABC transporter ATP-binding protein [Dehalococcoidia bacterium]|nr:MAG: ABC transporter ATP-binding protein [Dehalococcoidia bacterium]
MFAIRCEGLTKRYRDVVALDGLDLAVGEHSVFGFLGPNGAGKTTTVKLLVGLSIPLSGKAWIAGQEVNPGAIELRNKIGYLPEVPTFYNWMSGLEFLFFIGELYHLLKEEIENRCNELLELVELQEAAKRKIGSYSRGMRQRLGIAQALINRPTIIFLDEPCSALDPIGRRDMLDLIQRLSTNATVFMSTHILSDVERVCDSVGIIDRGRLVITSSIEELRRKYAHPVFEIEFEEEPSPFIPMLQSIRWLAKFEQVDSDGSPTLYLRVTDISTAKKELPGIVAASGLTLLRYEINQPTLEDIFVQLVNGEAKK